MNQERYDELLGKIAAALALVDEVNRAAHSELGYRRTRKGCRRVVDAIENLSTDFTEDWEEDERELDEELR